MNPTLDVTASFTEFDILVCLVIAMFTAAAFLRGFIHSMANMVFGWLGAGLIAFFLFPHVEDFLLEVFGTGGTMRVLAIGTLYFLCLAGAIFINSLIMDFSKDHRGSMMDRLVGLVFGIIKGVVVVSSLHLAVVRMVDEEPKWLTRGQTYAFTHWGYVELHDIIYSKDTVIKEGDKKRDNTEKAKEQAREEAKEAAKKLVKEQLDNAAKKLGDVKKNSSDSNTP